MGGLDAKRKMSKTISTRLSEEDVRKLEQIADKEKLDKKNCNLDQTHLFCN